MRLRSSYIVFLGAISLLMLLGSAPAKGEDLSDLPSSIGLADEELVTTAHFPRPASKIAENVTVITADVIARLNAHTLADVLQTVPGFQMDVVQTPGSLVSTFVLVDAISRHVLVQIDGVSQNFISADNIAEIGTLPVQMIDRVEIVKGAASAAWGSALGGVINVITKSPTADHPAGGMVSGSIGGQTTSDLRGEVSGTVKSFGFYLTGGNIHSRGFVPGNQIDLNHGFGKLTYDMPSEGKLTLGVDIRQSTRGLEDSATNDFHDTGGVHLFNGYLALSYPLAERLTLELNGRAGSRQMTTKWGELSGSELFLDYTTRELYQGSKITINWGDADNNLSAGIDYEHTGIRQRELINLAPENNFDLSLSRLSTYLNGTYTIGKLSILPGVRLDHTNLLEDAFSYTMGATYRLTDDTILRAYGARGYSMPVINDLAIRNGQRQLQNIWTVQTGIETASVPYLWMKGTLFYNNIWKIQDIDATTTPATVTLHDQARQGFDLEVRTSPIYGLALSTGYTYTDAWDKQTKAELSGAGSPPEQGVKLGLQYTNDPFGLRGALTGNYVKWNVSDYNSSFSAVIWDLHLTQKLSPGKELSPEIFFSAHNIFNGSQYVADFRQNTPRWFEGGARWRF